MPLMSHSTACRSPMDHSSLKMAVPAAPAPDMTSFTIRAFYEKDPEVNAAVQESYHRYFNLKADKARLNFDPEQFIPGLDIPEMYQEMYWASEGYLWEMVQRGTWTWSRWSGTLGGSSRSGRACICERRDAGM